MPFPQCLLLSLSVLLLPTAYCEHDLGIFKSTLAASNPTGTTLPFLLKYFPVFSSPNSCPNQECKCGATGRTEINGTTGFQHEATFGIHTGVCYTYLCMCETCGQLKRSNACLLAVAQFSLRV